jgi:AcrR family transcriptional regulator
VQARLDASRDALLTAAIALVAERGYAACSVSAVARRAGVATGSVYRHFAGKAELVTEVFRVSAGREVAAVTTAVAFDGAAADRVAALIETFSARALKSPRLAYALLVEPVDPVIDAQRLVFRRAFRDVLAGVVADGVRTGELPAQDPVLTGAAIVGAVGEALVGPLAGLSRTEPDAVLADPDVSDGPAPDTVPGLITFTIRALGGPDARDP